MKLFRIAAVIGLVLGSVLVGAPAQAGNWAVTSLDPLPSRVEAGTAYTVGFWVLQHGSHPYEGTMTPVGLKLVDGKGKAVTFAGTPLPEPAHYAASVLIPGTGSWQLFGVQGPFQEYRVGTLTVPGGLAVLPAPPSLKLAKAESPWGAIGPPQLAEDPQRDPFGDYAGQPAAVNQQQPAARQPAQGDDGPGLAVLITLAAGVVLVAVALLLTRRRWSGPLTRAVAAVRHRGARELVG